MTLKIRDIMVENVVTVDTDYTVIHAAKIMGRFGIGCVVALRNKEVAGILTERDLLNRVVVVAKDPEKTFVEEVMSRPVIVVRPDMGLEDAVNLMFKHRIKKLPVVEQVGDKSGLVGLVTLTDVARLQPMHIENLKKLFEREEAVPPRSMKKVMDYYIV